MNINHPSLTVICWFRNKSINSRDRFPSSELIGGWISDSSTSNFLLV